MDGETRTWTSTLARRKSSYSFEGYYATNLTVYTISGMGMSNHFTDMVHFCGHGAMLELDSTFLLLQIHIRDDDKQQSEMTGTKATVASQYTIRSTSGKLLQVVQTAVEDVRVTTVGIRIRILPDGLVRPSAGDGARRASIARQHQRVGVDEGVGVARAGRPPRGVGVQHRVPARDGVVPVAKGLDPRDHAGRAQAPAG